MTHWIISVDTIYPWQKQNTNWKNKWKKCNLKSEGYINLIWSQNWSRYKNQDKTKLERKFSLIYVDFNYPVKVWE